MKCPHCKKDIEETPLDGLKTHIKLTIKRTQKRVDSGLEEHRPALEKWKSWLEAVESLERKDDPIDFGSLSVRTRRILDRMGISTVEQIRNTPDSEFFRQKNCGRHTVFDIRRLVK